MLAAFAAVIAALATYSARGAWTGMDFRTTAYFPAHALLHGINPYDPATYLPRYPDTNPFPPFAPLTLLLYAPLALLAASLLYVRTALRVRIDHDAAPTVR